MFGDFACRLALQILGYLYPAYKTFKVVQLPATRSNDTLLRNWCQYWALMAVFTAAQPVLDTFFFWLPFYYEAKLGLAVYLWINELSGAQYVWARWFQPLVARYEPVVDRRLAESKSVAREWLHSNSMRLLAMAQAKALAWLAQVQAQAQQAAGRVAGGAAAGAAADTSAGAPAAATGSAPGARRGGGKRGGGSRARRAADDLDEAVELAAVSEGEEEGGPAEDAIDDTRAGTSLRGRRTASGGGDKKAAGSGKAAGAEAVVPEEPLLGARFSSFSLSSFYSARSSDLQNQDVQAGLKGFPVLLNDKKSSKDA